MIPYFSYEHINLGFITFNTWGLLVGLGFALGTWYVLRQSSSRGFDENKILNLILVIFVSSFIGARFFYALQFGWSYFGTGEIFRVWDGGLMFYGGMIGSIIGAAGYIYFSYPLTVDKTDRLPEEKLNRNWIIEMLKIADFLTPGIALGLIIGRIGCFLVNDHIGAKTLLPWAIKFPDGALRHPVILYLIISNILLFALVLFFRSKLKQIGALFLVFILWYSTSRLFLDFFRAGDQNSLSDPRIFNLTVSQLASMAILLAIAIVILFLPKFIADPPWAENNN